MNVPLPTWYHITTLSNFSRGYDKYTKRYSKAAIPESSFPNQFFVLKKEELSIGIQKTLKLIKKIGLTGDRLIALATQIPINNLRSDHSSGVAQYIPQNYIDLESAYFVDHNGNFEDINLTSARIEDITALSFKIIDQTLLPWSKLTPRTISILPIALACQASCKFCFSKASVSSDFQGRISNWNRISSVLQIAKNAGAERAVITGGGEPTLLKDNQLVDLIQQCSSHLEKVILITNAYILAKQNTEKRLETMLSWDHAGLSILAISRHHHDAVINTAIMGIDTQTEKLTKTFSNHTSSFSNISLRFVCVLQKGGIANVEDIENYLSWSAQQGVRQINFKELYVSTGLESEYSDLASNEYSAAHQVSLNIVHDFIEKHAWKKVASLPWGAPIFSGKWDGKTMQIAAYTEPSVYWERINGIARSWNLMSDGTVLASLEDQTSQIIKP